MSFDRAHIDRAYAYFNALREPQIIQGVCARIGAWCAARLKYDLRSLPLRAGSVQVYVRRPEGLPEMRVLEVGGIYQSASYTGTPRVHDHVYDQEILQAIPVFTYIEHMGRIAALNSASSALILGLGAGSLVSYLSYLNPDMHLEGVECERAFIQVGMQRFGLDKAEMRLLMHQGELTVHAERAETYIDRLVPDSQDAILIDLYMGDRLSDVLFDETALKRMVGALRANGILACNVSASTEDEVSARLFELIMLWRHYLPQVTIVDATDVCHGGTSSYILVGSDTLNRDTLESWNFQTLGYDHESFLRL